MVSAAFIVLATLASIGLLAYTLHPMWRARRGVGIAVMVTLALGVAAMYALVGTPAALDPARRVNADPLARALAELEAAMRAKPDAEGLRLLARSYTAQGRAKDARDASGRAVGLAPDDADVLVEAAEARAKASPSRAFDRQAVAWLEKALSTTPDHQRARWFLGIALRQQQRHADAARTWMPLLARVDARTARSLRTQIDAARKDAGQPPLGESDLPAAPTGIVVNLRLDPALRARLAPGARVFVLARMAGSAMPVAVETVAVDALPTTVTLDDRDSPMPTRVLSQAGTVDVLARISLRGVANAAPGDLVSGSSSVDVANRAPVDLVIDRAVQ